MDISVTISRGKKFLPGASPVVPGYIVGDAPDPNQPTDDPGTFLELTDVNSPTGYVGKNGFVPVVNNESELVLEPLPNGQADGLISGGIVQWTGTGYQFNVSSALARFQGVFPLQSAFNILTLTAADGTNPRIDLFILQILFDGDGIPNGMESAFITGTPAATPIEPQIDPQTQIRLTPVDVPALSTTPTVSEEIVYDENVEWTGSSSGTGTANFASAVNPYVGTVSTEVTNIQNAFEIEYDNGSTIDISTYQTFGFFIDLKAAMPANQNLYVMFLDGSGNPVTNYTLLEFDKGSTVYQFQAINLSLINFISNNVQYVRFRFVRSGGSPTYSGFFLDLIKLEGGINPPNQFGTFLSLGDTPNTYSGQGGKSVAVKADESGLEFVTGGGGASTFLALTDTPSTYVAQANKFPRVNGSENALVFDTVSPYDLDQEAATDGQVLTWVAANSRYEPVTPSGGGGSKWTDVGSDIYRNSAVAIGRTTIPTNNTFSVQSLTATASHRFYQIFDNAGVEVFSIRGNGFLQVGNPTALASNGPTFKGTGTAASLTVFRVYNGNEAQFFEMRANGTFKINLANNGLQVGNPTATASNGTTIKGGGTVRTQTSFLVINGNETQTFEVRGNGGVFSSAFEHNFGLSSLSHTSGPQFKGNTTVSGTSIFQVVNSAETILFNITGNGNNVFVDGNSFIFGTTTGTKIGSTTSEKLAFWNKTPIIQPTTGITGATRVGGGGATITDTDTFGGYTVAQLAAILINTGLTA